MNIKPLNTGRKTRTIVFSFDEKFAEYFSAALVSLAAHADKEYLYDIVVLHHNLSDKTIEKLQKIVTDSIVLRFFNTGSAAAEIFGTLPMHHITGRWDISTFYDLLVPLIMPEYERVLYCDSDIVFCADPGELFELSFNGRPLIAVRDLLSLSLIVLPKNKYTLKQKDFLSEHLGISSVKDYFNSGVILFNIPAIDKDVYLENIRYSLTFPELFAADQDILNYVFTQNTEWAPLRYNFQTYMLPYAKKKFSDEEVREYRETAQNPAIIHYSTGKKPWLYPDTNLSFHFWENAAKSPFFFQIFCHYITEIYRAKNRKRRKYVLTKIPFILSFRKGLGFIEPVWEKFCSLYRWLFRKHIRFTVFLAILLFACLFFWLWFIRPHSNPDQSSNGDFVSYTTEMPGQNVAFSHESGISEQDKLKIVLSVPEDCTVAFTTNCKLPAIEDDSGLSEVEIELESGGTGYLIKNRDLMIYPEFSQSFLLDDPSLPSGSVIRASAVSQSGILGEAETKIFFPGVDFSDLYPQSLIVSIITDPENLLDYDKGILASGAIYDAWKQEEGTDERIAQNEIWDIQSNSSQKGRSWERPCIVHIFDGDSAPAVELNAGIRITGNASRSVNQKSFNLYFRNEYGSKYLNYELFEGINQYKSIRLRGGGNNTEWLKFKDAFLLELVSDRNFTITESRPAVLFLNGEYWGPYLLTEKLSDQMLQDHYGVDKDLVILVKEGELDEGNEEDLLLYQKLMSYAEKDLSDPVIWQEFCHIMDINSMADYCAARIFFGDADWRPDKNDVLWRTRDQSYNEGRWQYVLYDVEFSSGMYGYEGTAPETDHFSLAQKSYPLFAAALQNREFYTLFMQSLREIGSDNCEPDRVEKILNNYLNVWEPLMPDYYKRFGNTRNQWEDSVNRVLNFFQKRYAILLPAADGFSK